MKGRIFFGILVVIVGVLLLLMALDVVPIDGIGELLLYIPSLFILWGLYVLVVNKFKRAAGPIVTIAIATIVQLVLLDILRWEYVWPIAIILVGVAIIACGAGYHGRRKRRRDRRRDREHRHAQTESRTTAEGDLDISVTMSEAHEHNRSQGFKGGDITCVMGRVRLDLTEAEVADPPAHIHVDIVMGGLEILVPDHWIVRNNITRTMGEVGDHTESRKSADPDVDATLILDGSVVMGHATIASASRAAAD
jgi:predicted membrane protein